MQYAKFEKEGDITNNPRAKERRLEQLIMEFAEDGGVGVAVYEEKMKQYNELNKFNLSKFTEEREMNVAKTVAKRDVGVDLMKVKLDATVGDNKEDREKLPNLEMLVKQIKQLPAIVPTQQQIDDFNKSLNKPPESKDQAKILMQKLQKDRDNVSSLVSERKKLMMKFGSFYLMFCNELDELIGKSDVRDRFVDSAYKYRDVLEKMTGTEIKLDLKRMEVLLKEEEEEHQKEDEKNS